MSFAGWVRVDEWTNTYNRIFDFGKPGSPCVRLHRNHGNTLRFAINSWDITDAPDFFAGLVGQEIFIAVAITASGERTIYRNGEVVVQQSGSAMSSIDWPTDAQFTVGKNFWLDDNDAGSRLTTTGLKWWVGAISQQCIRDEMAASRPTVTARLDGDTYADCQGTYERSEDVVNGRRVWDRVDEVAGTRRVLTTSTRFVFYCNDRWRCTGSQWRGGFVSGVVTHCGAFVGSADHEVLSSTDGAGEWYDADWSAAGASAYLANQASVLVRGAACPAGYQPLTSSWQDCRDAAAALGLRGDALGFVDSDLRWGSTRPQGCFCSDGNSRVHFNRDAGGGALGSDRILCTRATDTCTFGDGARRGVPREASCDAGSALSVQRDQAGACQVACV
jgi:hypothetical protein